MQLFVPVFYEFFGKANPRGISEKPGTLLEISLQLLEELDIFLD